MTPARTMMPCSIRNNFNEGKDPRKLPWLEDNSVVRRSCLPGSEVENVSSSIKTIEKTIHLTRAGERTVGGNGRWEKIVQGYINVLGRPMSRFVRLFVPLVYEESVEYRKLPASINKVFVGKNWEGI